MRPAFQIFTGQSKWLAIGGLVAAVGLGSAALFSLAHKPLSTTPNIFSLVGNLHGTTGNILTNTRALSNQVNNVESRLQVMTKQQQILAQQTATGQALAGQLQTQIKLTTQNVNLMQQILGVEKGTAAVTSSLRQKSDLVASQINTSAQQLSDLYGTLQTTSQESATLNGQMDTLLQELQSSQQEFRAFGQVNQLLAGLGSPSSTNLLGQTLNSATKALGGSNTPLGTLTSGLQKGGSTSSSSPTSALGSVTNTVSGLTGQTASTPSNSTSNQGLLGLLGGN